MTTECDCKDDYQDVYQEDGTYKKAKEDRRRVEKEKTDPSMEKLFA